MAGKNKNYELQILIGGKTDRSLEASINKAKRDISSLERSAGLSSGTISDTFGGMSVKGIDGLAAMSDKVFGGMVKAAELAGIGIVAGLGYSAVVGSSFEAQMSTVQSISNASGAEMEQLNALAKKMGRDTKFSATEAGQGYEYMAMAGWKTQDMLNGLPGIMNLAAASGEDLGMVSDIVTDALTAFGLKAQDSTMFADVLAAASSNSNTNVAMMGETFKYVAPIAGALGYSVQDTAVEIGLMANSGIKASQAGTSLRKILTGLGSEVELTGTKFGKMTVKAANADGSMRKLSDITADLRAGFEQMSDSEKTANAENIAGKTGMSGLLAMMNAADTDVEKLKAAIDSSAGASERMSKIRLDNLRGDVTLLKSSAEGAGIEIYGGMSENLRAITQSVTKWINSFTGSLEEKIPTTRRMLEQFGKSVEDGFGPILDIGKWFLKNPHVIKGSLTGIVGALVTFKAVKVAKDGVALLSSLSGMVSAWPVAAAGLVVGGIVGIGAAVQEMEKQAAKQNLAEHFGDITLSMKELSEVSRHVIGDGLFMAIDEMDEVSDRSSDLYKSMQSSVKELKKADWKLSIGLEFDESDQQSYMSNVDAYVKNAQEYVTNKGYELKLAVDIVMGDDLSKDEMISGNDEFYKSLYGEMEVLQNNINAELANAMENGFTLPVKEIVSRYMDSMAEITQLISDSENSAKLQMIQGEFSGMDLTPESFQNLQKSIADYTETALASVDESQQKILAGLNVRKMTGDIGDEEFKSSSETAMQVYYQRKAETIMNGYQAMKDTIMDTYGAEIGPALDSVEQSIQQKMESAMNDKSIATPEAWSATMQQAYDEAFEAVTLSPSAKNALKMLLKGMEPSQEQMSQLLQQYQKVGGDISDQVMAPILGAMNNTTELQALSGSADAMWKVLGDEIGNSEAFSATVLAAQKSGGIFSGGLIDAISEKQEDAVTAADNILKAVHDEFSNGVDPVTVPVPINYQMTKAYLDTGSVTAGLGRLGGHAEGGIFDQPHIAWFAEEGPEAAIPLDGSDHAVSLWQEAGRLLGTYEQNNYGRMYETMTSSGTVASVGASGAAFAPVFSPQIYFQGTSATQEDVSQTVQLTYEQFKEWSERLMHERERTKF